MSDRGIDQAVGEALTGPTLTALVGLPGSGKTTWARHAMQLAPAGEMTRLCRDDLRTMLHSGVFTPTNESQVVAIEKQAALIALCQPGADHHVIVDDTNLRPTTLAMWRDLAASVEAEFKVRSFLDMPLETCIERDARRAVPVGEQVIREMNDGLVHAARRWVAELEPV